MKCQIERSVFNWEANGIGGIGGVCVSLEWVCVLLQGVCVFKPKAEGETRVLMKRVRVIERGTGEEGSVKRMMTLKRSPSNSR